MKILAVALSMLVLAPKDDVSKKVTETYASAADWLASQQDKSGAWTQAAGDKVSPSPAFTGLIVAALGNAPGELKAKYKEPVLKGLAYLLSKVNADGSIGEGPTGTFMKTYATGIALMAFSSAERTDKIANAIRGAQAYLKQNQLKEGKD